MIDKRDKSIRYRVKLQQTKSSNKGELYSAQAQIILCVLTCPIVMNG